MTFFILNKANIIYYMKICEKVHILTFFHKLSNVNKITYFKNRIRSSASNVSQKRKKMKK